MLKLGVLYKLECSMDKLFMHKRFVKKYIQLGLAKLGPKSQSN